MPHIIQCNHIKLNIIKYHTSISTLKLPGTLTIRAFLPINHYFLPIRHLNGIIVPPLCKVMNLQLYILLAYTPSQPSINLTIPILLRLHTLHHIMFQNLRHIFSMCDCRCQRRIAFSQRCIFPKSIAGFFARCIEKWKVVFGCN